MNAAAQIEKYGPACPFILHLAVNNVCQVHLVDANVQF